ncbi:MAG: GTPase Era [Clostridia bacterium]|nr:GTPase Era [Clostridia bacterium]MCI9459998.1 GTPase Era [Clostridia bacterium]
MIKLTGDIRQEFVRLAGITFDALGLKGDATVDVELIDDEAMRELNRETRKVDATTDVLSYPALDEIKEFTKKNYPNDFDPTADAVVLGDIAINVDAAARQAEEYGTGEREINYLFVHGLLHILGYDHMTDSDKAAMRAREEEILGAKDESVVVAVIGRPNAGKSSLVNAIVGEKVSIVSPKPQTTRDRITGICTEGNKQIVFLDTPGMFKPRTKLDEHMDKSVKSSLGGDADVIVIVLDCTKGVTADDEKTIMQRLASRAPVYIVLNKTDLKGYEHTYPIVQKLSALMNRTDGRSVKDIIPTSCRSGRNIDVVKDALKKECKEGGFLFPPDEYTDRPVKFMIGEIVREKALLFLQDEIPHGVGVAVLGVDESKDPVRITADVIVDKQSHKRIVIGDDASMIKRIGAAARRDIQELLGANVYLELFVKVRQGWRDKQNILHDIGY